MSQKFKYMHVTVEGFGLNMRKEYVGDKNECILFNSILRYR